MAGPPVGPPGAAASRGSPTPVARLKPGMKAVGPAFAVTGLRPVRRLEADDLGHWQRRIQGLARRRARGSPAKVPASWVASRSTAGVTAAPARASAGVARRRAPEGAELAAPEPLAQPQRPRPSRPGRRRAGSCGVVAQADEDHGRRVRPASRRAGRGSRDDRAVSSAAAAVANSPAAQTSLAGEAGAGTCRCRDRPSRARRDSRQAAFSVAPERAVHCALQSCHAAPRLGPAAAERHRRRAQRARWRPVAAATGGGRWRGGSSTRHVTAGGGALAGPDAARRRRGQPTAATALELRDRTGDAAERDRRSPLRPSCRRRHRRRAAPRRPRPPGAPRGVLCDRRRRRRRRAARSAPDRWRRTGPARRCQPRRERSGPFGSDFAEHLARRPSRRPRCRCRSCRAA